MKDSVHGIELVQLRKNTKISQSDVAQKMGVDQSSVSRLESDAKVWVEDAQKYLAALDGDPTAKDFAEHLASKWRFIEKPAFRHPYRKELRIADEALAKLQAFTSDPATPADLIQQIKIYEDILREAATYLFDLKHNFAFVGNIMVGKTTALCFLINLLIDTSKGLKQRAVLETGAGWVTLGQVHVSTLDSGVNEGEEGKFGLVIQSYSPEEIFRLASDLSTSVIAIRDGTETESRVPEEMERALRSMASLTRKTPKDSDEVIEDPLLELAKTFDTSEKLTAEFVSLMKLDHRTTSDIWLNASTIQDGLAWLQSEFRKINNGRNPKISLPKRIDVFVPMKFLKDSPYDLTVIDTKGADGSAIRPDIQACLDDPRTVTVLCSRFAPDASMLDLLGHLSATGKTDAISGRTVFLVLPRPDEALAIDNEDGNSVQTVQEAYSLREAQIRSKLAKFPGSKNLPILFFDASQENPAPIAERLQERLNSLRISRAARLKEVAAAIEDLVSKRQQKQAQAAFAKLRAKLQEFVIEYRRLPGPTLPVHSKMIEALKYSHARTVWASARRNGDWTYLNSYHLAGVGANMDAKNRSDAAMAALNNVLAQLSAEPDSEVIRNHLVVLKGDVAAWRLKYLEEVSRRSQEIFRAVLYPDHPLWANCTNFWGQGKGFRHRVAESVAEWLKANNHEWIHEAVEGITIKDWQEFFIARIEELAKDPSPEKNTELALADQPT